MSIVDELLVTLDKMVHDQFESQEFKSFLSVPLTMERGRFYVIQNALYTSNRRDCWAYVQGSAPLDVKRGIWHHESDELVNDPVADTDHSDSISVMFERYVKTPADRDLVLQGARDCMAIDRAYRGALGYYMAQMK